MDNQQSPVVYLNNIGRQSVDPYSAWAQIYVKGLPFWRCKPKASSYLKHLIRQESKFRFVNNDPSIRVNFIRRYSPKENLIVSYEDNFLDNEAFLDYELNHDDYVGHSDRRSDILILRDPYNLMASLVKSGRMNPANCDRFIRLFKQYARAFLDNPQYGSVKPKILVNYNDWFVSTEYRIKIGHEIGFSTQGEAFEKVPGDGTGSTFDSLNLSGKASQSKVLERWKSMVEDEFYRSLFKDVELVEMSKQIFGLSVDF
ncbi:hypothetical protein IQ254_19880 [Nodosilinea sp. LEGE 07088]|uniref:hypothetical protein n=1 Tax=Nodosilinea sp. LEGE 07088 TaxID=2777968 RepID=UPI00187E5CA3|nr:hypothetical protein [Nodosilinea sp. LEGE 07088]MBE9139428.1 hypothetical protein [Nodosilinea sp. LEGE 07088]